MIMSERDISDHDKLILVARVYANFKGDFSPNMLYDFLLDSGINFRKAMTCRRIGMSLAKSKRFKKIGSKDRQVFYELVK